MFVIDSAAGGLTACAGVVEQGGGAEVISMWVAPESRGLGLGRALLERAAAWARARGHLRLRLHVVRGNQAAAGLYEAFGFRATGRVETNEHGREELEMELELPV